jgi:Glu-tRNA(Gln) amidotransferase subunit E-like FAD-binding protein
MYPDTDSPPTRITRERVGRLSAGLAQRPWEREIRYRAANVPLTMIHFLIRRGGAALVDLVVAKTGAAVRQACFFFGARLVYLRRDNVDVAAIPAERWIELFRLFKVPATQVITELDAHLGGRS